MQREPVDPGAPERRLTYDDFVRIPDDGRRHEIIDGKHYVTPSPNLGHQELIGRLFLDVALYLRQHPGAGRVFLSPLDVLFTRWDIVEPDLLFVAADQTDILTELNVQGPPALVVEILSRGTRKRDLTIKRRLFDRGGVRGYWAVDPKMHLVMVFARQNDGSFPQVATLSRDRDEVLTTSLLPGLTIRLSELFA
jgi:Uma2 family endonuclease